MTRCAFAPLLAVGCFIVFLPSAPAQILSHHKPICPPVCPPDPCPPLPIPEPCPPTAVPCPPAQVACTPKTIVEVQAPEVEFRTVPAQAAAPCLPCLAKHRQPTCLPCQTAAAPMTVQQFVPVMQQMMVAAPQMVQMVAAPQAVQYVAAPQFMAAPQAVTLAAPQAIQMMAAPQSVQVVAAPQAAPQTVQMVLPQAAPTASPQATTRNCPEYDLQAAAALLARARENMAANKGQAAMAQSAGVDSTAVRLKNIEETLNLHSTAIKAMLDKMNEKK